MAASVTTEARMPGAAWPAAALWAAAVVPAALGALLGALNGVDIGEAFTQFLAVLVVAALSFATVGALILARRPGHRIGLLMCAAGVGAALPALTGQYARYALVTEPGSLPAAEVIAWLNLWIWPPGLVALMVFLPLLFPDGRLPSSRWRPVVWVALVGAALIMIARALGPGADPSLPEVPNPYGAGAGRLFGTLATVGFAGIAAAILAAIAAVFLRFRGARGQERLQLKWLLYAGILLLIGELVVPLVALASTGDIDPRLVSVTEALAAPWLAVGVAVAVLRHRLYDIDLLVNRTLLYAGLTAAVVGLYVLVVGYFGAVLEVRGEAISLLAAAVVAVAFQPLRQWLQRGINHLLYGQRDEPHAVLTRLGRRLEASLEPDAVLSTTVETVREALKLPYAAIAMGEDEQERFIAAESGPRRDATLGLPLVFRQRTVGELLLAPRTPGEAFTAADRALLEDFARQASVAAHAVGLTAELRRAHRRLVSTREEERRRIRRDLHDGLGPQLASQVLSLDAARAAMRDDPRTAESLLHDVREQTKAAVADIRRLVYDLRPPALDDHGLAEAVREQAARYGQGPLQVTVEVPQALPTLPAAVETAAFRIVAEALANVARHAGADACAIRLSMGESALELEVADDGRGLPDGPRAGVGLKSMHERAAELGGRWAIECRPGGGTIVRAQLPLEEMP